MPTNFWRRTLAHLLHGCDEGAQLCGRTRVQQRTRALAAGALGLCASRFGNPDARRYAAHHLVSLLEDPREGARELQVACVNALGSCPQSVRARGDDGAPVSGSRAAQLAWLLDWFEDARHDFIVRSHVPAVVARLLDGAADAERARALATLRKSLRKSSKEPREVRWGAALALGAIGDADEDEQDLAVRAELVRALSEGDAQTRHFALIALAQVGARPGAGSGDPLAGAAEARRHLVGTLARGRSRAKPWAGLALGILGRGLLEQGLEPSRDASLALMSMLHGTDSPEDVGACALALGLRRHVPAQALLERRLDDFRGDDATCGELALALGLLGEAGARDALEATLARAQQHPLLLSETAIALALLDGGTLDAARAAAARALGRVLDARRLPWPTEISLGRNYLASSETL